MKNFIGTRAEREWLATARRIATALERLADTLEATEEPAPRPDADGVEGADHD